MCELSPVTFHGDTIFCVEKDGQPYTPMKTIVENMGLDWSGQAAKFRSNKGRWSVEMISTVAEDGKQRELLCLPIRKLPGFLASINPKKVKAEISEKVIIYQNECDDALWDYWTKGRAERKPEQPTALPPTDAPITPDQQCTLQALVKARIEAIPEAERPKGLYPQIWNRFKNHFRVAKYSQLPQTRMSEAVEYLAKMELRTVKPATAAKSEEKTEGRALPQSNTVPPADIPPVPECDPDRFKILRDAQRACRDEIYNLEYRRGDVDSIRRAHVCLDLYKAQSALWGALFDVYSAVARTQAWESESRARR